MLGYIATDGRGASDRLLERFARHLQNDGVKLAGAVQINDGDCETGRRPMLVELLANGRVIKISQELGPHATGCRLDAEGLEIAAHAVADAMRGDEALLILNKFGKQERDGQGFRDVIVQALDHAIPVLLGVNPALQKDFLAFAGEFAVPLNATFDGLNDWFSDIT